MGREDIHCDLLKAAWVREPSSSCAARILSRHWVTGSYQCNQEPNRKAGEQSTKSDHRETNNHRRSQNFRGSMYQLIYRSQEIPNLHEQMHQPQRMQLLPTQEHEIYIIPFVDMTLLHKRPTYQSVRRTLHWRAAVYQCISALDVRHSVGWRRKRGQLTAGLTAGG